jgi:hypothetical protein
MKKSQAMMPAAWRRLYAGIQKHSPDDACRDRDTQLSQLADNSLIPPSRILLSEP